MDSIILSSSSTSTTTPSQILTLDVALRNWVLLPIMLVMVLVGVLRHHVTQYMAMGSGKKNTPSTNSNNTNNNNKDKKKNPLASIRETQALLHTKSFHFNSTILPPSSFTTHKSSIITNISENKYLKDPNATTTSALPNPMMDPQGMEVMMEGMKKNMAMIIPQTLIMSWITFFFSGFVLIKLPFPLTLRFKSMLQRGIETSNMDVSWVSSLSWYFLNLFGLRSIFSLILGEDNSADSMMQQTAMMNPMMQQPGAAQQIDYRALFKAEKENLELLEHSWVLEGVEERVLKSYTALGKSRGDGKKNV